MAVIEKTVEATYEVLKSRLSKVVPDAELRHKAELAFKINQLKAERGALILGHNYMEPALYLSVTDIAGDSLELCRKAAKTDADPIVFCGVKFMAETAKILNPERTVLIPSPRAGCSLAESITAEDVRSLRERYPGVPIVTYINTYADVKAECDVVCTSGNAALVTESLKSDTVIFLPDEYLARNVARETGRHIIFPTKDPVAKSREDSEIEKVMIGWSGKCEVHEQFTVDDIVNVRKQFPEVLILSHPECSPEVVAASDYSGSTSKIISYVKETNAKQYLLLTECSMGDNIIAENPEKEMVRLCSIRCPHMNEITLEETLAALQKNQYVTEVDEDIRLRAKRAVDRMLAIGSPIAKQD